MTRPALTFRDHAHRFTTVVDTITDWAAPSPCDGWAARDVLTHVVETQGDFLARHGHAIAATPEGHDPAEVWRRHDASVQQLLGADGVAEQEIDGAFGPTTIGDTMATFYGFDLVVHRWDLAQSAGRDEHFTDDELELLERSVAGFGEHLYGEGICKPAVAVPDDASRQERVLALLGRSAR